MFNTNYLPAILFRVGSVSPSIFVICYVLYERCKNINPSKERAYEENIATVIDIVQKNSKLLIRGRWQQQGLSASTT